MEINLLEELARSDSYWWDKTLKSKDDSELVDLAGSLSHLQDLVKDEIKSRLDKGTFYKPERVSYLFAPATPSDAEAS